METKKKECWGCGRYKAYYTKGWCHFDKEKLGKCLKHKKTVDHHEVCEFWTSKYSYAEHRKKTALHTLNELLKQFVEIKQILAEDKEESGNK